MFVRACGYIGKEPWDAATGGAAAATKKKTKKKRESLKRCDGRRPVRGARASKHVIATPAAPKAILGRLVSASRFDLPTSRSRRVAPPRAHSLPPWPSITLRVATLLFTLRTASTRQPSFDLPKFQFREQTHSQLDCGQYRRTKINK